MVSGLIIRPSRPAEDGALARIGAASFPAAEAASPEQLTARLAAFPECFLTAELDGAPIGFINGARTGAPALPDELYHDAGLHRPDGAWQTVFGLSVLPEYRRRGVAAVLLRDFIGLAKGRNCAGAVLTCKERLIHYYERFGFVNRGVADSTHGGAVWYDMRLTF